MESFLLRHYRTIFTVLLIAMLVLAFLMGFLTGKQQASPSVVLSCPDTVLDKLSIPVAKLAHPAITDETQQSTTGAPQGAYVGSKNGTKYYRPQCSTVKRIKPENYVWFQSTEDAQLQGYTEGSC